MIKWWGGSIRHLISTQTDRFYGHISFQFPHILYNFCLPGEGGSVICPGVVLITPMVWKSVPGRGGQRVLRRTVILVSPISTVKRGTGFRAICHLVPKVTRILAPVRRDCPTCRALREGGWNPQTKKSPMIRLEGRIFQVAIHKFQVVVHKASVPREVTLERCLRTREVMR